MPPHGARYPAYTYSAGQWPQQLYPYPQYPQAYAWGYPQYPQPQFAGGPAIGNPYPAQGFPLSPRQRKKERHRSLTPPPEIQLHHLLGGRYRPTAVWDVSQDLPAIRHLNAHGGVEKVPISLFNEPATNPPISKMRIVSDAFPWDVNIALPRNEVVLVEHVLGAIYGTLQNPLEKEDWDEETPNAKRNMHKARCIRLSKAAASYKVDMHIKQVDALGDKTLFMGLKPVGNPEDPQEWLLKLGAPQKQGRQGKR